MLSVIRYRLARTLALVFFAALVVTAISVAAAPVELTIWTHHIDYFVLNNPESPGGVILNRYMDANPNVSFSVELMDANGEKLSIAMATDKHRTRCLFGWFGHGFHRGRICSCLAPAVVLLHA